MKIISNHISLVFLLSSCISCLSFTTTTVSFSIKTKIRTTTSKIAAISNNNKDDPISFPFDNEEIDTTTTTTTRRSIIQSMLASTVALSTLTPNKASAAVGTLPEYSDTNAILQGVTIDVADKSQQDEMISFLVDSFDFVVLRRRQIGSVTDTWMGFGPEQLSVPSDFELPVSSFSKYGGHASIHIRYDAKTMSPLYKRGDAAPGDNIAYLQVGVPTYRISQMVRNGGNVLDAYGIVNVVSPSGLPMRGIVGIVPDPIMFVALNCKNVKESKAFYEQLGFVEQEYPYARPSKGQGQFEPPQPPKSIYMAPSANCMGVLLLPANKKKINPNPVVRSLNLVYTPSADASGSGGEEDTKVVDPSGVVTNFVSVDTFDKVEKMTLVPRKEE